MMRSRTRRRGGFTLVELMIVIAIIAILVSLLLAGVVRVLAMQSRTETQTDITKMQSALQTAMTQYNHIPQLPSRLILYNDTAYYTTKLSLVPAADQPLATQTANVLRYMFGKRFIQSAKTQNWGPGGATGIRLEGAECLTFYLGGMPRSLSSTPYGCMGFANDPEYPTDSTVTDRIGPFYEFRSARLRLGQSNAFFTYDDPYGTPFAFFGPFKAKTYDTNESQLAAYGGVKAYYDSNPPNAWLSPTLFQIISAGPDKLFGGGGAWDTKSGAGYSSTTSDNLANFTQTALSEPQQ